MENQIDPREPDIKGMREESYQSFLQDLEDARKLGVTVKEIRAARTWIPDDSYLTNEANIY